MYLNCFQGVSSTMPLQKCCSDLQELITNLLVAITPKEMANNMLETFENLF